MTKDLAAAVLQILDNNPNSKRAAKAIAAYLVAERRTNELSQLLRQLEELQYERDGHLEVTATVARPLSNEAREHIQKLFSAKKVTVHQEINQAILGGVKVRALDKALDFSVQTRLQRLRVGRK